MKKAKALATSLLFTAILGANAQDFSFSQFYASPLTVNPAQAGYFEGNYRFVANYKDQWGSIANPFTTIAASVDHSFMRSKSNNNYLGVGVNFYSDKSGSTNYGISQANLSIAYNLQLSPEQNLAFGLSAGYAQRSIDLNNVKWGDEFNGISHDPGTTGESFGSMENSYVDLGAGALWNYRDNSNFSAYAGIAAFHLNQPEHSFLDNSSYTLPAKYVVHGGLDIFIGGNMALNPGLLFIQQDASNQFEIGSMLKFAVGEDSRYTDFSRSSSFSLGGFYRLGDAAILATQFDYKRQLSIGMSYDFNVSSLRAATNNRGGFEISMIYLIQKNAKRKI